jgi:hypothetical protein
MSRYDWALLLHLVGAFALVGGMAVAAAGHVTALRRERQRDIAVALGVGRTGVGLVGAGSLLVVGFGTWLVDLGDHRFGDAWISAAYALFIGAVILGGLGGPPLKRARLRAEQAVADGPDPDLHALLRRPAVLAANYGAALLMAAVLVLMVWKPGG